MSFKTKMTFLRIMNGYSVVVSLLSFRVRHLISLVDRICGSVDPGSGGKDVSKDVFGRPGTIVGVGSARKRP